MSDILTAIFPSIFSIIGSVAVALFTKVALPWLQEQAYYSTIQKFVAAAEKLAETGVIDKSTKKEYVLLMLEKAGVDTSDEKISTLIEAAVNELDRTTAAVGELIVEEN